VRRGAPDFLHIFKMNVEADERAETGVKRYKHRVDKRRWGALVGGTSNEFWR
jgi:hypothetical protein